MIDGTITIRTKSGARTVSLASYLGPAEEESAHRDAHGWIKQLRLARVDGRSFRQRFTVRGDSLWWFSEIYLHRQRAPLEIHRALAATVALIESEQPSELRVGSGSAIVRHVVPLAAAARGVRAVGGLSAREWAKRLRRVRWRARALTLAAWGSRLRAGRAPDAASPKVAAFIHRAFWRSSGEDGSAESYIGPVLKAIEERTGAGAVAYVGVGPSVNFRARRWWSPFGAGSDTMVVPIERYAPWRALRDSRDVWRAREANFLALSHSEDLRRASTVGGVDCWPIIREQFAGIAFLQWPWSARAMDEAASALDALGPSSVLTYAEAGGWGRALILEARRRGIPSAGLQHGFIYRQWLNYLHEPDEMEPDGAGDAGFPAPTATLLFDDYAARHLRDHGRLPPGSLRVTGSPRLDALMASLAALDAGEVSRVKRSAGANEDEAVLLVTTKEREARGVLPALLAAAGTFPGLRVVIKPHPAETHAAYESVVSGRPSVSVVPADTPLAPLLAASRAVVTVNSTVALDAAVAGIPSLVIGLPNNLSPFVDAGVLAGAATPSDLLGQLGRVLYDEGFRQQLSAARTAFLGAHAMNSNGMAARHSADAVLDLTSRPSGPPARKID